MESLQETYASLRSQPLGAQIAIVSVALLLTLMAIGLPILIKPSSDLVAITESCGGHMTDDVRRTLLRVHNEARSKVALGDYKISAEGSALTELPPAVRMYQLKYNCSLERSALNWAGQAQCQMIHSQWPGIGENLYASGMVRSFMYSANVRSTY
ncbi:SCP-like protein [Ostertagia ostertagi]